MIASLLLTSKVRLYVLFIADLQAAVANGQLQKLLNKTWGMQGTKIGNSHGWLFSET